MPQRTLLERIWLEPHLHLAAHTLLAFLLVAVWWLGHDWLEDAYVCETTPLLQTATRAYGVAVVDGERLAITLDGQPLPTEASDRDGPLGIERLNTFRGVIEDARSRITAYEAGVHARFAERVAAFESRPNGAGGFTHTLPLPPGAPAGTRALRVPHAAFAALEAELARPSLASHAVLLSAIRKGAVVEQRQVRDAAASSTPPATTSGVVSRLSDAVYDDQRDFGYAVKVDVDADTWRALERWVDAIHERTGAAPTASADATHATALIERLHATFPDASSVDVGELKKALRPQAGERVLLERALGALTHAECLHDDAHEVDPRQVADELRLSACTDAPSSLERARRSIARELQRALFAVTRAEFSHRIWIVGHWRWIEIVLWAAFGVMANFLYTLGTLAVGRRDPAEFEPRHSTWYAARLFYAPAFALVFFFLASATNLVSDDLFGKPGLVWLAVAFLIGMRPNDVLMLLSNVFKRIVQSAPDPDLASEKVPSTHKVAGVKSGDEASFDALQERIAELYASVISPSNTSTGTRS